MNRRTFLINSSLAGLGALILPGSVYSGNFFNEPSKRDFQQGIRVA